MTKSSKKILAIDFGASSGRAIVGTYDGESLTMEEIHRFTNDPVNLGGTLYWDFLRLFHEVKQSLIKAKPYDIESIAIDTWGVDFGLIDADGRLLENPVHYRDRRTAGMVRESERLLSQEALYQATGNQIMEINTAFQLLSLKMNRPGLLERADTLLLMPDLFTYYLCGQAGAECSIASTTQLFDQEKRDWSYDTAEALGIPLTLLPKVCESGTVAGMLSDALCEELGIDPIPVIRVCGHDTQSALAAVPAAESDFAFLSSGTWSLLGTELNEPLINDRSRELAVTNEQGICGKTSFLENIIGLWLIQESRRQWMREGHTYSFAELTALAREATPFRCLIDPDAPEFVPAGNMPQRIRDYCSRTHQYVPQTVGEIVRCIDESLALKYRSAIEKLSDCTGRRFETLYVIGGGTKDQFLSELTANACQMRVASGPAEATAMGNLLVQLMAQGEISNLAQAREIVRNSEKIQYFEPQDKVMWDEAYVKYLKIISSPAISD